MMKRRWMWFMVALAALLFTGCGDDSSGSGGGASAGEGGSCATVADCDSGQACVMVGGAGACTISCSVSGNECSGQASCGSVGVAGDFCQREEAKPDADDPPSEPEEQPRIPCSSDAECETLAAGAICAQWEGQRDCTLPCTQESQCTPPSAMGITFDVLTCLPDESDASRSACVPDEACFNNPMGCISGLPNEDGFTDTGFPDSGVDGTDGAGTDGAGTDGTDGFPDGSFDGGFDGGAP